jgi:hypothetical protein
MGAISACCGNRGKEDAEKYSLLASKHGKRVANYMKYKLYANTEGLKNHNLEGQDDVQELT